MDLTTPPPALTRTQRAVFWAITVACALTRLLARARTISEWDEVLFAFALGDYDVARHHPHPPGFPIYIAVAKIFRTFIDSDFRALQSVNLLAAAFVFPAVFLFARELRLRFSTCVSAALLFSFFPNVWFFGGSAFSDIPSIVLVVFAVVFLLRGVRSPRDYFIGTLLLALAAGIRSQNLLVGLVPGLLASRRRRPAEIAGAALLGFVVLATAYGSAMLATGLDEFRRSVAEHGDYIWRIDSYRSAVRPALWRIFDRFFFKQYQSQALSVVVTLFVFTSIAGAVRQRDRRIALAAATFVPFAIFAWLMLDRYSISRFSIGYAPLFAVLAADGIRRAVRNREQHEVLAAAALAAAFAIWTWPALTTVRTEVAPPVRAVEALRAAYDPARDALFIGHSLTPFIEYLAPELSFVRVLDDRALPVGELNRRPLLLAEVTEVPEGQVIGRERGHLWNIARHHYFRIALKPIALFAEFREGWHPPAPASREASGPAVIALPRRGGPTVLRLQFTVPGELALTHPTVTLKLNGRVIGRIRVSSTHVEHSLKLVANPLKRVNLLEMHSSATAVRTDEQGRARAVALELRSLSWGPT